ncbi:hypothetical protein JZ751_016280, partial [Albula glossodonta]
MGGLRCIIGGCYNRPTSEISLYKFPSLEKDPSLHQTWVRAVKKTRQGWGGPTPRSVICSAHFGDECFKQRATSSLAQKRLAHNSIPSRKRRTLEPDAIPTVFSVTNTARSPKKRQKTALPKRKPAKKSTKFPVSRKKIVPSETSAAITMLQLLLAEGGVPLHAEVHDLADKPCPTYSSLLLSSLHLLVPPLQLISAAMWQVVQQQHMVHYGKLEEFVSLVMETVPELLSDRQRTQLTVGLRERMASPVEFESKTDTALQVVLWELLSRLEQLLPVPDLKQ